MLHVLKRILLFLALGAIAGDALTMVLAPQALEWFQTPSVGSALCNCAEIARETAHALIRAQLLGALCGAIAGGVLGEVLTRLREAKKRRITEQPAEVG